ncbi:Zinc knuckle [Ceratocystis lukuohia]|uniref:Zinc knuckle n=1 Tax=Ceratocystis lukuohia TaxID=2019550 RepID=A0ABR4MKX8_9PEZI
MSENLGANNWSEWEMNFLHQLKNDGLYYLLDESPMEGVERDGGGLGKRKTDEDQAMRSLTLSLGEGFGRMTNKSTVKEAYELLKKICEPDTNWYYHKMTILEFYTEEQLSQEMVLKMFLIGLPKEYQEVAKECYREKLKAEDAVKRLEQRSAMRKSEESTKKSKLKCFNCNKGGHKTADCRSKKKTSPDQKAQMATQDAQQRNPRDS